MKEKYKLILLVPLVAGLSLLLKAILPKPVENLTARDHLWTNKTHSTRKFDIVVIGDSRTYRGVSTEAMLEGIEGFSAMNFGYSGTGFNDYYMDFVQSRLKDTRKKIIVIGITPYSLSPEGCQNVHLRTIQHEDKATVFKNRYLNRVFKHFNPYLPREIWDFTINARERRGYYQEFSQGGWIKSYTVPEDPEQAFPSYIQTFNRTRVSKEIVDDFLKRVKQWNDSGICIIGYRIPSSEKMVALEDSISGFDYLYVKENFQKCGGHWIEFDDKEFRSYDGSHLHYTAAEKLSRLLGRKIRRLCLE